MQTWTRRPAMGAMVAAVTTIGLLFSGLFSRSPSAIGALQTIRGRQCRAVPTRTGPGPPGRFFSTDLRLTTASLTRPPVSPASLPPPRRLPTTAMRSPDGSRGHRPWLAEQERVLRENEEHGVESSMDILLKTSALRRSAIVAAAIGYVAFLLVPRILPPSSSPNRKPVAGPPRSVAPTAQPGRSP